MINPTYNKTKIKSLYIVCYANVKTVARQQYALAQDWHVNEIEQLVWGDFLKKDVNG